jgi:type II secretory ATPase GspE/PulE/Tfp pilus assembly ATPase PilB-like protein
VHLVVLPLVIHTIAQESELLLAAPQDINEHELISNLKLISTIPCKVKKINKDILRKAILLAYKEDEASSTIQKLNQKTETDTLFQKRISICLDKSSTSDIPQLLQALLTLAFKHSASDIHMVSLQDNQCCTAFRIDGMLQNQEHIMLPQGVFLRLVQHVKVISGLDTTEHFSPLDGMFEFTALNQSIRVRVSIIPNVHGVKLALRLLYHPLLDEMMLQKAKPLDLLGLLPFQKELFQTKIRKKGGLMLLSGPTGSGKSTLLYALCSEAAEENNKHIVSIEDPVERTMPGVTQIEVGSDVRMSYHSIFKSTLRQDPDMIILSEIRDKEALHTALQASLSGTIVLSTIHASNVIELILRLFEMGCSPISLGASLKIASSQRLLGRNCPSCRTHTDCPKEFYPLFGEMRPEKITRSTGCSCCNFSGISGRVAVYETCEPSITLISELSRIHTSGFTPTGDNNFGRLLSQSAYVPFSHTIRKLLLEGEISPEAASTLYF